MDIPILPEQAPDHSTTDFPPSPSWTLRRVAAATLVALGIAFCFFLLYRFYTVVFIFFIAVALQIALRPAVAWLERRGIVPRWSVPLLFALLLALLVGAIVWGAPLVADQLANTMQQLPQYYASLRELLLGLNNRFVHTLATSLPAQLQLPGSGADQTIVTEETVITASTAAWQALSQIGYGGIIVLVVLLLAYYWTLEGEAITRRGLLLVPQASREEARSLLDELESKMGDYFRGQAILCLVIGVLSTLAFLLIGVPNALLLGVVMGVFEALPVIGPTLGAIPAIAVTLAVDPIKVVWVIAALMVIQVSEAHLLVPRIMNKSVGVNAIVTILSITAFGLLFGVAGAILAIPLAAMLQILLNRLLFQATVVEQTPAGPASEMARDHASLLQREVQELVQDVRKHARAAEEVALPEVESIEEQIEIMALELERLLQQQGQRNGQNRPQPASWNGGPA